MSGGIAGVMRVRRGLCGGGLCALWALCVLMAGAAAAQERGTRLIAAESRIADAGAGLRLELALGAPVPWRLFTLDAPRRLVVDLAQVDLAGADPALLDASARVTTLRMGLFRPGWSRLVLVLDAPYRVDEAAMRTAPGGTRLDIALAPATSGEFAAGAGAPDAALWPMPQGPEEGRQAAGERIMVVLDPGHGGLDPGAERDGATEAELMLLFARELRDVLRADGRYEVRLTRDADLFVPLAARAGIARQLGADVFLSLHADALPEGRARGATLYTLSDEATDPAAALLAARHDEADRLAGADLSGADDLVTAVLMDLVRTETAPRAEALAHHLAAAMDAAGITLYTQPVKRAGFSVLRAPDFPSVLIELGFLSEPDDLANLRSPDWRAGMARAIHDGLGAWLAQDRQAAPLRRR